MSLDSTETSEKALPFVYRALLVVLFIAGLGLIAFVCVLAYRDGFSSSLAVPCIVGALFVGTTVVGFALTGPITVKRGDTEVTIAHRKQREAYAEAERPQGGAVAPGIDAEAPTVDSGSLSDTSDEEATDEFQEAVKAYIEKDAVKFDGNMQSIIEKESDAAARVRLTSLRLSWLFGLGQGERLQELERLQHENAAAPDPLLRLADAYLSVDQPDKARRLYLQGETELPGLSEEFVTRFLKGEVESLLKVKDYTTAESRLKSVAERFDTQGWKAEVNKLLAEVYDAKGDLPAKHYRLELAVEANPGDYSTRFGLAFSYAQEKEELLALYHYNVVVSQRAEAGALNNRAILLELIELPIVATRDYRAAIEKNNSLAAANLAKNMLKAGLAEEARQLLATALTMPTVHENVHEELASLARATEAEEERLKKVAAAARQERTLFLRRMADDGRAELEDAELLGEWNTSVGKMTIARQEQRFAAKYKTDVWDWALIGDVVRASRVLSFDWATDHFSGPKKGTGYLLFGKDTFEGIIRDRPTRGEVTYLHGTRPTD